MKKAAVIVSCVALLMTLLPKAAADGFTASITPSSGTTYPNQSLSLTFRELFNGAPDPGDYITFNLTSGSGTLDKQVGVTDGNGSIAISYVSSVPSSSATIAAYKSNGSAFDEIASATVYVLLRPATYPAAAGTKPTTSAGSSSSTTSKTVSTPSTPSSQNTTPNTPPATLPAPLSANSVNFSLKNGKKYDASKTFTIPQKQMLHLSGTAPPNNTVTLTIHSSPRTASVVADPQGKWQYDVTGLTAGRHSIEATITDPTTSLTSTPTTLAHFIVRAPLLVNDKSVSTSYTLLWLELILIALGVVVVIALKKRTNFVKLGIIFRSKPRP